jgi:hypothetical protein
LLKTRGLRSSGCTISVVDTAPVANGEKNFNQQNVKYAVWTPLGSKVILTFFLRIHVKVSAVCFCVTLFAMGVVDNGGAF